MLIIILAGGGFLGTLLVFALFGVIMFFAKIIIGLVLSSLTPSENPIQKKYVETNSTFQINDLEVMTKDLGEMTMIQASQECESFGDRWRLPTIEELSVIYENRILIGSFCDNFYLSYTEHSNGNIWCIHFGEGSKDYASINRPMRVCPVRDL